MTPESLLHQLDVVAVSPNGVARLRELILQLAVRGKLLPQVAADEPVDELLERITDAKERLQDARRTKERAELEHVPHDLAPYAIPPSWRWVRLSCLGEIVGGGTPKTDVAAYWADRDGIPWLTPADMNGLQRKHAHSGRRQISKAGLENSSAQLLPAGAVLFSSRAPIGYVAIAANPLATNQGFKSCVPYVDGLSEYIFRFLQAIGPEVDRNAPGTTFREVSGKIVGQIAVPLPPLEEQQRIVAKVDELMALCAELEVRQQRRAEARARLNRSVLHHLAADDDAGLTARWRRLRENFGLLYDTPETVAELRRAVIQLAVRGRLVAQNLSDEPARVTLERIRMNQRAGGTGTRVAGSLPMEVSDEEVPFVVPQGWVWTRFAAVVRIASDLVDPRRHSSEPHVAPDNIEKGTGRLLGYRTVAEDDVRSSNHRFFAGQILYSKIRPNLAKAVLVDFGGLCSADMYPIDAHIDARYLLTYMLSPTFLGMVVKNDTRVAMPKINQAELSRILVPVPPISEQARIVKRVGELTALCDRLAADLVRARERSAHLAASVVHHLTAA